MAYPYPPLFWYLLLFTSNSCGLDLRSREYLKHTTHHFVFSARISNCHLNIRHIILYFLRG